MSFWSQVSTGRAMFATQVVRVVAQDVTLSTVSASRAHVAAVWVQLTTPVTGRFRGR